ncbi:restriction endonuclease subunit S [Halobacillus trueperi]|uniref:Restriction endonuclease subunit S n=1 Tax=Halobacillus trueperi TaxID=156205 RepID=A0A3E0J4U6_9BACI|nr:restriction endonuclease subunit S [Halobacillus trueperi]REJ07910.1 restriction endonuclease subunit S [Halobacillus trueperi]
MENKRTPIIRFHGFSGEWVQNKLGEVVEIKDSARIPNTLWLSKGVPYLRSSDMVNNGVLGKLFISEETYQSYKDKTGAPEKGDVLFTSGGKVGVTYHKIDDNPVYVQGGSVLYAKTSTSKKLSGIYLNVFFSSPSMTKYMEGASTGLTIKHFTLKPAKNTPINLPSLKEQTIIGEFFKNFDDRIALQQREIELLEESKQGFLQKMFPKDGERVPAVRFDGFRGEWDDIKADSIFKSISDKNHTDLPVLSASQKEGMVFRDDIGINIKYEAKSTKTYKRVQPGQFVIHLRSFQGGFAYSNIEGITSPAYTILDFQNKESQNFLFWKYVLTSKTFIKRLETVTYGIRDGKSISFSDFSTLKFKIPDIQEQRKIGEFFKKIDDSIATHEKELELLKETKKGFLQKMFV